MAKAALTTPCRLLRSYLFLATSSKVVLRLANIIFGAWLIPAPLLLAGYTGLGAAASVTADVLLILLALPVGPIRSHYGAWDRWNSIGAVRRNR